MKRSLHKQYYWYLLIIIISIGLVAGISTSVLRSVFYSQVEKDLIEYTKILENLLPVDEINISNSIQKFCSDAGNQSEIRITVLLPSGRVMGDSQNDPLQMENHADRPEIIQAFQSGDGFSRRFSYTLQKDLMYYAKAVYGAEGLALGVLRLAVPLNLLRDQLEVMYVSIFTVSIFALLISIVMSLYLARRINQPIYQLIEAASVFGSTGQWPKTKIQRPTEIALLDDTITNMAEQLQLRMDQLVKRNNEIDAVFFSMVESVIVLNSDMCLTDINKAATNLLHVTKDEVIGRNLLDVIRNTKLYSFAEATFKADMPCETELLFSQRKIDVDDTNSLIYKNDEVFLQVNGTTIYRGSDQDTRLLLVFNNITRIKQLEEVRKDFVANVSHELKTPITSIKGFVETLLDGALEDQDTAKRFLAITLRQTEQLNAVLDDLLILSRLEKNADQEIERSKVNIKGLAENARQVCQDKASGKNIVISLSCQNGIQANVHAVLLEQAVVNLIDNAVKYSPENTEIQMIIKQDEVHTVIRIIDQGNGIPEASLSRIFERFYRIDKGRSRENGGTGLGLSIVKHIALAHNGEISVKSTLHTGSEFTLKIPN